MATPRGVLRQDDTDRMRISSEVILQQILRELIKIRMLFELASSEEVSNGEIEVEMRKF